jgi:hypothetical protein
MLPRPGQGAWLLVELGADSQEEGRDTAGRFQDWLVGKKGYAQDRVALFGPREPDGDSDRIFNWLPRSGVGARSDAPASRQRRRQTRLERCDATPTLEREEAGAKA